MPHLLLCPEDVLAVLPDRPSRSSVQSAPRGADYNMPLPARLQVFSMCMCVYIAVIAISKIITMTRMMITLSSKTDLNININVDFEIRLSINADNNLQSYS